MKRRNACFLRALSQAVTRVLSSLQRRKKARRGRKEASPTTGHAGPRSHSSPFHHLAPRLPTSWEEEIIALQPSRKRSQRAGEVSFCQQTAFPLHPSKQRETSKSCQSRKGTFVMVEEHPSMAVHTWAHLYTLEEGHTAQFSTKKIQHIHINLV